VGRHHQLASAPGIGAEIVVQHGGDLAGAVGVSGASEAEDQQIANAAAAMVTE
jgi:uncharacterized protein GlcG (DUF336 family)